MKLQRKSVHRVTFQRYSRFYTGMRARKNYSIVLFGNHSQDTLHGKIFYINANCKIVEL